MTRFCPNPILSEFGGDLPYTGPHLEPSADLEGVNLNYADLTNACLRAELFRLTHRTPERTET